MEHTQLGRLIKRAGGINYTDGMRSGFSALATISLLAILLMPALGIEKERATGVLLRVERKSHDRVLYYLYNTPVMQEDPYVEVSVEFRDRVVVGEYIPSYAGEPMPENWNPGESIDVRLDKHYIYLPRPNGTEVKFRITDRYTPKESASHRR